MSTRKKPAAPPITNLFSKRIRLGRKNVEGSTTSSVSEPLTTSSSLGYIPTDSSDAESGASTSITVECDIGKLMELHTDSLKLCRDDQYRVLTTEPNSDATFYPRTRPCESSAYRQFQPAWLKQHPWLHYSQHVDGAFCRACVFFAPDRVFGQSLESFVNKPFRSWIKMSQKANAHATTDYHQTSMSRMSEFLARYKNPSQSIDTVIDSEAQKIMTSNQKVIESLLKIIMLCGKQGLALRGHRDDHIDWIESEEEKCSNQGNFVELVRFWAEHDHILSQHLANSPRNARYTSKTIQNELVQVIGTTIRNDILCEVQRSKFYTIIADEVADVSNKEQLSLALRYVLDGVIKEVFVHC